MIPTPIAAPRVNDAIRDRAERLAPAVDMRVPPSYVDRAGTTQLSQAAGRLKVQEAAAAANPQRKPDPMIAGEPLPGQDASDALHKADAIFLASGGQAWWWWGPVLEGNVAIDGIDSFRLSPANPDARPGHVSQGMFSAILEKVGVPYSGATSTIATARGVAAMIEISARAPENAGLSARLGKPDAHLSQVEAIGVAWGLPPELIEQRTGRPFDRAGKYLFDACAFARPLEQEQAREQAKQEAEAAASRARVEAETRLETRSIGELGLVAVATPIGDPLVSTPRDLLDSPAISVDGVEYRLFKNLPGMECAPGEHSGHRVVEPSRVFPVSAKWLQAQIRDCLTPEVRFMFSWRARTLPNLHQGPIDPSKWRPVGEEARAIVARHVHELYMITPGRQFVPEYACQALCRACLLEPLTAIALLWSALMDHHAKVCGVPTLRVKGAVEIGKSDVMAAHRPIISPNSRKRVAPKIAEAGAEALPLELNDVGTYTEAAPPASLPPYRGATSQEQIGAFCLSAANAGAIEPGCLILKTEKHSSKKGNSK